MRSPRCIPLCVLAAFLVAPATSLFAEVSVRTDRRGGYVMTHVIPTGPSAAKEVWSPLRGRGRGVDALNPEGDQRGDRWPTVAESPRPPFLPWVVWSRSQDKGFELSWSTWSPAHGWSPIASVAGPGVLGGDELDPDLTFDKEGRPYLVWWSEEAGKGQVYVSLFLSTRWMAPFLVSAGATDGRNPTIEVGQSGRITVQFDTPDGRVSQLVYFHRPITITDDINPQGRLTLKGSATPLQQKILR